MDNAREQLRAGGREEGLGNVGSKKQRKKET